MSHQPAVRLETVTTSGRSAVIHLRVLTETVEVWRSDRCQATFDRDHLRGWIDRPETDIRIGEVVFSLDHSLDRRGQVAISMPDITAWTLSPESLADLRRRI